MSLVEFVGGPYDGSRRQISSPPSFVWVNEDKVYRKNGPGRSLYRSVKSIDDKGKYSVYLFSAHTYGRCESCDAFGAIPGARSSNRCSLCGGTVKVGG